MEEQEPAGIVEVALNPSDPQQVRGDNGRPPPLLLFEATRKLWFAFILTKLLATTHSMGRLGARGPSAAGLTMFIKWRSMDLSVVSLMNVLETAKEWK